MTNLELADYLEGAIQNGAFDCLDSNEWGVVIKALRSTQPEGQAITLLRAWVAGCGDEHFSTKDQCRELLQRSGDYLASLTPK